MDPPKKNRFSGMDMRRLPYKYLGMLFILILLAASCARKSDKDVIVEMAEEAARYAGEKDVKSIMAFVSKDYRDNYGNDRDAIKGIFVYQLLRPGKAKVFIRSLDVEAKEGKAMLEARVVIARGGGEGISGETEIMKLNVVFKKEDGGWKATSAEWGPMGAAGLL